MHDLRIPGLFGSLLFALSLYPGSVTRADVTLAPLFTEGVVLQRDRPIPVWGTADAGEAIVLALGGKELKVTADASGRWRGDLPPLAAGGPFELTARGKNRVTVPNVAVGEVWVASGQSNMAYWLYAPKRESLPEYEAEAKKEVEAARDPMLRMFTLARVASDVPLDNMTRLGGRWQAATPENAPRFSAVAYHFAKALRQKLNVPVGIINTSWGSTPAQSWISLSALEANPGLHYYIERREEALAKFPQASKHYEEVVIPRWEKAVEASKSEGKPAPRKPEPPVGPQSRFLPANLFNAMINPLVPYGIKGVIWYQGESNGQEGRRYRTLFPALIQDWRTRWQQGEFPFLFVQLANYKNPQQLPVEKGSWADVREAQLMTLSLPNTGMASAIDLADPDKPGNIHPRNKKAVGERLALNALAKVYGQKVASYCGPIYSGMKIEGNRIRLSFRHADGGLKAREGALKGFALAGKDGRFVWGDAVIDGDSVVVSSKEVPQPSVVRYGWAMNPIGNLYNKEGLPASPFRTDPDAEE